MARVFSAIDITDQNILSELEHVRNVLDLDLTPVKSEKMHITLQFFEDVNEYQLEKLKTALDGVEIDPFDATIKGVGAFPSEDYIRVVWAGAENHGIREIHSQVSSHEVKSSDHNHFTPHVTLLRVKNISQQRKLRLKKSIQEFSDHYFGQISVDKIKIFESHLGPDGSDYRELYVNEL